MKKMMIAGIVAGFALLLISVLGLYAIMWLFPTLAAEYFGPAFNADQVRITGYFIYPFVLCLALSWLWARFKRVLAGSFITRGIEFGLIYALIAVLPMMLLIYSSMNVSLAMVSSWFVFATAQGLIAGLIFEKVNP